MQFVGWEWNLVGGRGGGGSIWVTFFWVCAAGLLEPYPIIVYSVGNFIVPILVTFGQICNFCKLSQSHFLFMYLPYKSFTYVILKQTDPFLKLNKEHFTFHLQYKCSGMFTKCKYDELSYPQKTKMCDPILVTLLKMPPYPVAHPH